MQAVLVQKYKESITQDDHRLTTVRWLKCEIVKTLEAEHTTLSFPLHVEFACKPVKRIKVAYDFINNGPTCLYFPHLYHGV